MRYRLLALDLDGTLLGPDHRVRRGVPEALSDAQAAGLGICLATGRSYIETVGIWRELDLRRPFLPLVLVGGAMACRPDTGETLYQRPIPRALACEFDDALAEAGYPSMALVDASHHEWDYLLTEAGDADRSHRDWFAKMDVRVRRVPSLADSPELPLALRISTVVEPADAEPLERRLKSRFGERLNLHAIVAPNYGVTIVEAFAPEVSKLSALRHVAEQLGVRSEQIVAVGDDVNDIAMIRGVGLGAAMPNATASLAEASDHHIQDSLALFIRRIASGRTRQRDA